MIIQHQLNYTGFISKSKTNLIFDTYTTPAQSRTDFYSKVKTNIIVDTYTTTTQLYNDCYSKGDIDTLLTDKISATGK